MVGLLSLIERLLSAICGPGTRYRSMLRVGLFFVEEFLRKIISLRRKLNYGEQLFCSALG